MGRVDNFEASSHVATPFPGSPAHRAYINAFKMFPRFWSVLWTSLLLGCFLRLVTAEAKVEVKTRIGDQTIERVSVRLWQNVGERCVGGK